MSPMETRWLQGTILYVDVVIKMCHQYLHQNNELNKYSVCWSRCFFHLCWKCWSVKASCSFCSYDFARAGNATKKQISHVDIKMKTDITHMAPLLHLSAVIFLLLAPSLFSYLCLSNRARTEDQQKKVKECFFTSGCLGTITGNYWIRCVLI